MEMDTVVVLLGYSAAASIFLLMLIGIFSGSKRKFFAKLFAFNLVFGILLACLYVYMKNGGS